MNLNINSFKRVFTPAKGVCWQADFGGRIFVLAVLRATRHASDPVGGWPTRPGWAVWEDVGGKMKLLTQAYMKKEDAALEANFRIASPDAPVYTADVCAYEAFFYSEHDTWTDTYDSIPKTAVLTPELAYQRGVSTAFHCWRRRAGGGLPGNAHGLDIAVAGFEEFFWRGAQRGRALAQQEGQVAEFPTESATILLGAETVLTRANDGIRVSATYIIRDTTEGAQMTHKEAFALCRNVEKEGGSLPPRMGKEILARISRQGSSYWPCKAGPGRWHLMRLPAGSTRPNCGQGPQPRPVYANPRWLRLRAAQEGFSPAKQENQ